MLRRRFNRDGTGASTWLASLERSLAAVSAQLEAHLESAADYLCLSPTTRALRLDLLSLVKRLIASQPPTNAGHQLKLVAHAQPIVGAWDEGRLAYVVRSLVDNAVHYSPAGGEIVVTLERRDAEAVLRIVDHGVGIGPCDLPHVFEPVFRAPTAEGLAPGLGLGLATTRLIVEQYGGSIHAESIEAAGTTFTMRLPLELPSPLAPS